MDLERLLRTFGLIPTSYLATLAIGVVCAYLGLFCVLRRIVFTGVALAQLAAAGVAGAFFLADHPATPPGLAALAGRYGATAGSMGLALGGVLALEGRPGRQGLTPDARVGVAYSAAAALAILLVWRSARGLAELQNILAGEVLLSGQRELLPLFAGLALVAAVHLAFRRQFLLVSFDPEFARALGLPERRFQLLLLGTLAVAVALSLQAGGLLLVFAFLVLPPVTGLTLGEGTRGVTLLAAAAAAGGGLLGFTLAIAADLPVAPSVAAALLALFGLARAASWHPALRRGAAGLVLLLAALALLAAPLGFLLGRTPGPGPAPTDLAAPHAEHDHAVEDAVQALSGAESVAERCQAAERLGELLGGREALEALVVAAAADEHPEVRAAARAALGHLFAHPHAHDELLALLGGRSAELRAYAALALTRLGETRGVEGLVAAATDRKTPLLLQEDVLGALAEIAGPEVYEYDPARWRRWWEEQGRHLHWDPARGRFEVHAH